MVLFRAEAVALMLEEAAVAAVAGEGFIIMMEMMAMQITETEILEFLPVILGVSVLMALTAALGDRTVLGPDTTSGAALQCRLPLRQVLQVNSRRILQHYFLLALHLVVRRYALVSDQHQEAVLYLHRLLIRFGRLLQRHLSRLKCLVRSRRPVPRLFLARFLLPFRR